MLITVVSLTSFMTFFFNRVPQSQLTIQQNTQITDHTIFNA